MKPRLIAIAAGFAILAAALALSLAGGATWAARILDWLDRLRALGVLGWLIFVLLQTLVALIGFLPASLLGLAAGAVYGVALGFGLSSIGLLLGAGAAFSLARSALRPAIIRLVARRDGLRRFDAAIKRDGWRLVLLMRVSPVMPFSITSFALGLSGIGRRDYALGTLASLPALALYVTLGALGVQGLTALRTAPGWLHLTLIGAGLAATLMLTLRIGQLVARAARIPG
ncbi:VTT domain-containing protein [Acidiphilium sp. PA]|uniref:TVP38/TMEM64 family protein n=1 Tax=Acidiphilium sp. PA TaxID=2871705 RepID=UPI002244BC79|nr:VTT domain-containing protein [Acidiphilium sp. PA]MCW8305993.1 VTT domain-containing protein [Acidiphilium sp. PA]